MAEETQSARRFGRAVVVTCAVVAIVVVGALLTWRGDFGGRFGFSWRSHRGSGEEGARLGVLHAGAGDATSAELAPNRARPETGTGEAYLDHSYRAFIEAQQGQLGLTPAQANQLVNDLLEFQEVKSEVVGRFLHETTVEGSTVTVQVPAFPVEGRGLRDLLLRRLRTDFPDNADRIVAEMGGYIDETFEGFGLAEQTYVVRPGRLTGTFEVEWTARVPEGASPQREPDSTTYGGGSGVLLLSRDQIENGELRFLAPVLARHFPAATK